MPPVRPTVPLEQCSAFLGMRLDGYESRLLGKADGFINPRASESDYSHG